MSGRAWVIIIIFVLLVIVAPVTMGGFIEHTFTSIGQFISAFHLH